MNGFLKFGSFELRDDAWKAIADVVPDSDKHLVRATSLPHIVVIDLDADTVDQIREVADGNWFPDVQFRPMEAN